MRTESNTEKNITPGIVCTAPWRLTKIKPLPHYRLKVEFVDGVNGYVEMSLRIMSDKAGVFAALKDVNFFNQVHLEYGVATWPDEIDLAPDAMYDEIKRKGRWVLK
jgi:hypothetical protein